MRTVAAVTLCVAALALPAQDRPPRPSIAKGADGNSWEAYYTAGVEYLRRSPTKADAAFFWAARLDPTRAEPIYARWVAYWMNDISEFPDYLAGSPRVIEDPHTIASDSLRFRAWERNPLVNQALMVVPFAALPGGWRDDPVTNGWLNYANGFYDKSIAYFSAALHGNPKHLWLRYDLALVWTQKGRYDSALAQLNALLEEMRKTDRKQLVYFYESKEMYEYAVGLLYSASGKPNDARAAQERALIENLAFAPAHAALAQLAAARRDTGTAVREYALAVELAPKDGVMYYRLGGALLQAQRPQEALVQLKTAMSLEPYFAKNYLSLGDAYFTLSDSGHATSAYLDYLKRAPHDDAETIEQVKQRLAALGAAPK